MKKLIPGLIMSIGVLLLSACNDDDDDVSTPSSQASSSQTTTTSQFTFGQTDCQQFDWQEDLVNEMEVKCGYLTVPEDHFDSTNDQTIRLAVAVFKATDTNPATAPVFYLEGGPGGSTIRQFKEISKATEFQDTMFGPLLPRRDVVLFDQRGVGASHPALECPEMLDFTVENLDKLMPSNEYMALYIEAALACSERLKAEGQNLAAYNSVQSASDIELLRQALGYNQINLFGVSYGVRLALTTMREWALNDDLGSGRKEALGTKDNIRAVIIDGVYPPEMVSYTLVLNVERAFNLLFAECQADSACSQAFPNLETEFYALVERLNEQPESVSVEINGVTKLVLVDGTALIEFIVQLFSSGQMELIPFLIHSTYTKENDALIQFAAENGRHTSFDGETTGMYLSVQCYEDLLLTPQTEIEAILAQTPDYLKEFAIRNREGSPRLPELCQQWGVPVADYFENERVYSDIPTLIVSGNYDPLTPPLAGESAALGLNYNYSIVVPNSGHGSATEKSCPASISVAFLDNPTTTPDTSCIANMMVEFVIQ